MSKLYTERDIIEQGDYYSRHTSAMTGEGLDRKSDIAAELAHRDIQIDQLQARVAELEGEQLEVWLGSGDKLVADIYADDGGWAGVGIFNPPNGKTQGIGEKDDQIDGMSLDKNKAIILIKSTRPESLQVVVEELQEAMAKMGYTHPASADDSKHHAVMQAQIWAQEARTQKAIVKEIGEMVGCANDWEMVEAVRDALANVCVSQSAEYETQADLSLMDDKQAASVPEWIKCSDRLPAEYDGDFEGLVWVNDRDMTLPKYAQSRVHWSRVRGIAGYTHWMPTGFRRPQPPKQEGE